MTGQPDRARALLDTLASETIPSEMIRVFVDALIAAPDTPYRACLAAYGAFARYIYQPYSYYFGVHIEQTVNPQHEYSPERIGCAVDPLIVSELANANRALSRSPLAILRAIGLGAREMLISDLNGDGAAEWLVWPSIMIDPILFVPDGDEYAVSMQAIDPYRNAPTVTTWTLPDGVGRALAWFTPERALYFPAPWVCNYDVICGYGGEDIRSCEPDGRRYLSLYRLDGTTLNAIFSAEPVCRALIEALFPGGPGSTTIDGGELVPLPDFVDSIAVQPIRYVWDGTARTFVRQP